VESIHTRQIGVAANTLGAGRMKADDVVDLAVGLLVHKKPGDRVEKGEPLVTLHHRNGRNLQEARKMILEACSITDAQTQPLPLILEKVHE
jgi:thymidine phosphorylase